MSLNIKIEPFEESSSIVDLSSDEDDLVSEKIEIPEIRHLTERPGTPDTHCSICLEELTNKCHSDSCWHLFCFECLKRWSTIESSCPLCKKIFKTIHHTLADTGIHETYEVPTQERELSPRIFLRPFGEISDVNRMNLFLDIVRRNERLMNNINTNGETLTDSDHIENLTTAQYITLDPRGYNFFNPFMARRQSYGQTMRLRVYNDNVWAEPLPDLSGRYRDCNSAFYRNNPAQTYRLHGFILRDITAIRSLQRTNDQNRLSDINFDEEVITNLVMRSISNYEIRDPIMTGMLRPYLGQHTAHFCHELYNYANSPYDMIGYDRNVRYSSRQDYSSFFQPATQDLVVNGEVPTAIPIPVVLNHNETIILDSDEDEELMATSTRRFTQEVIVLSSSSEDSDVEILSHSFRPIEVFDSSSRDLPSTSTGIRDSLDRPNNRYNLRRRRLFSPNEQPGFPVELSRMTYSPSLRRERIVLDSSSSDDESISSTHDNQAANMKSKVVCRRRKRKTKRNKHKKRKRNSDESCPENHVGCRSRSYSESSSSSGDTDSRPNNNCMAVQTNVVM